MAVSVAFGVAGVEPDVERELRGLARSRGALRRVVAELAARFAAREGWAALGYARLGDYARERLGVSDRSLQEWARVGERLRGLPALEAALVSGQLGWSAVRDLARVVEADDEREWIAFAANLCAHTLQRELRAVARGVLGGGVEPVPGLEEEMRRVAVRVSRRVAFGWWRRSWRRCRWRWPGRWWRARSRRCAIGVEGRCARRSGSPAAGRRSCPRSWRRCSRGSKARMPTSSTAG